MIIITIPASYLGESMLIKLGDSATDVCLIGKCVD